MQQCYTPLPTITLTSDTQQSSFLKRCSKALQLAQMQENFFFRTHFTSAFIVYELRQANLNLTEDETLYAILHLFLAPEDLQPPANVGVTSPIYRSLRNSRNKSRCSLHAL